MIADHTANQRNGSGVSKIWQHGGERRRVDDGTMDRYWRCGHCNNKRILKCPETGRGATFNSKVSGKVNALQQQGRNSYITQSNILYYTALLDVPEMTLDLKVDEVEVKVLTSLTSVTGITGCRFILVEARQFMRESLRPGSGSGSGGCICRTHGYAARGEPLSKTHQSRCRG
jgi:hypothetical protein